VKKKKQRAAKAASRKQRGKPTSQKGSAVHDDADVPAWPTFKQLRDRLLGPTVGEPDSYRFEQSLQ
jgi:hypothetical protein